MRFGVVESGDAAVKRQQSFLESIRTFCRSASDKGHYSACQCGGLRKTSSSIDRQGRKGAWSQNRHSDAPDAG